MVSLKNLCAVTYPTLLLKSVPLLLTNMRTLGSWRSSKIGPYRTVLSTGRNQITAQREDQCGERKERSIFCRLRPKTSLSAPPVRRRLIWHTCQHLLADGRRRREWQFLDSTDVKPHFSSGPVSYHIQHLWTSYQIWFPIHHKFFQVVVKGKLLITYKTDVPRKVLKLWVGPMTRAANTSGDAKQWCK